MTIIKDPIYGFIEVPKICKKFMDTPEFQRLRNIKQLGFTYFVYPSATHTRFEHCLGVMHLSGEVVEQLRKNGEIRDRDKELVQLAGLFHDIGHVATSHLIDYMLKEEQINDTHEQRSCKLLEDINNRLNLLTKDEVEKVYRMIHGSCNYEDEDENHFLFQIISNKKCGLDVDRFDYLQRDAYHIGLPRFSSEYIIKCMKVDDNRDICFLKKAYTDIQTLFETRKRMFTLVYRHKSVMRAEKIVRDIIKNETNIISGWKDINILNFDDIEFMSIIKRSKSFSIIYDRTWEKEDIENVFEHCTTITRDEIEKELVKIKFV